MRRWIAMAISMALVGFGLFLLPVGAQAQAPAKSADEEVRVLPEYRLGSGDKIRVITFGEEALTGQFEVSGSGKVSLPLAGEIDAAGLTVGELQERIQEALKQGYLKEPRVSVEVLNYRPFYILGEVKAPGTYPYINSLTVVNAVATAGGFTYRANTKRVFIKRADDTKERSYPLRDTTPVAPGDTIRIVERYF